MDEEQTGGRRRQPATEEERPSSRRAGEVFLVFLRLGCLSFGGPIAHLGYFETEFVERRRWVAPDTFLELVALAQSLPGPASSQVGYSLGLLRAGPLGGLAAFLGFTTPSALLMLLFALGQSPLRGRAGAALLRDPLQGLQLAAVAVVAQAVMTMQRKLAPDRARFAVAFCTLLLMLFLRSSAATVLAIALGAVAGFWLDKAAEEKAAATPLPATVSRRTGVLALGVFGALLGVSFLVAGKTFSLPAAAGSFYRAGAMVFGGGHVVLPLLDRQIVARGWMARAEFLSGYAMAQAMPGPLFSFSAFLGAALAPGPQRILWSVLAVAATFLPGLLLMTGVLPFWEEWRRHNGVQRALRGVRAAVVGVLLAALFDPIWTSTVHTAFDFALALGCFVLLVQWRWPPWAVVLLAGCAGLAEGLTAAM